MPRRSQPRLGCRGAVFAHRPALAVGCGPGSYPRPGVRSRGPAAVGLCSPTGPPWLWAAVRGRTRAPAFAAAGPLPRGSFRPPTRPGCGLRAAGCGPRSYPCPGARGRGSAAAGLCSPTHRRSQPQARCSRPRFAHPAALRLASAGVPPRAQPPHPPAAGSSTEQGGRGAPRRQLRAIVPPGRHGWAQRHLVSAEPRNQPDPSTSAGCPRMQAPAPTSPVPDLVRSRPRPEHQRGVPPHAGAGTNRSSAGRLTQQAPARFASARGPSRETPARTSAAPGGRRQAGPGTARPARPPGPASDTSGTGNRQRGSRYRQPSAGPWVPAAVSSAPVPATASAAPGTGNPQPRPRLGSTSPARRSASAIALLAGAGAWREAPPPPPRP